jgi:hypothetical protein
MMEEHSRKRQGKQHEEDDSEEVKYPSHDFDNVWPGGIDVHLVIPIKPKEGDKHNSSDTDSSNCGETNDNCGKKQKMTKTVDSLLWKVDIVINDCGCCLFLPYS